MVEVEAGQATEIQVEEYVKDCLYLEQTQEIECQNMKV